MEKRSRLSFQLRVFLLFSILLSNSGNCFSFGKHIASNATYYQQQSWVLNGLVTNENGEPLVGASVLVKGTNRGTKTDNEGKFILEISVGRALTCC